MSKIIEETVNTVINEDTVETVMEAVQAIPVKSIDWGKIAKRCGIAGVIVLGGVGVAVGIKHVLTKKKTDEQTADSGIDNVKVAEHDFVDHEETEAE
jgi:hypothetical protein